MELNEMGMLPSFALREPIQRVTETSATLSQTSDFSQKFLQLSHPRRGCDEQ
jgi:hypothetical protein